MKTYEWLRGRWCGLSPQAGERGVRQAQEAGIPDVEIDHYLDDWFVASDTSDESRKLIIPIPPTGTILYMDEEEFAIRHDGRWVWWITSRHDDQMRLYSRDGKPPMKPVVAGFCPV